jgi:23S rRNA (pseudouridine1915-N3)-methyltransferase
MKDGPERELQARYLDRARASGKALGITAIDLVELAEGRATRAADRKSEEARAILERTGEGIVIALDERGTSPTSTEFSSMLETFIKRTNRT